MIRQRRQAYWARDLFGLAIDWTAHRRMAATSAWRDHVDGPVFCFTRFGRSVTQLSDGRLVYVGGEQFDTLLLVGNVLLIAYKWTVARTVLAVAGARAAAVVALSLLISLALTAAVTVLVPPIVPAAA